MKAISYLLLSEFWLIFVLEKPVKHITIQEVSYDRNDKVKMTVKDKIKKIQLICSRKKCRGR